MKIVLLLIKQKMFDLLLKNLKIFNFFFIHQIDLVFKLVNEFQLNLIKLTTS